MVQDEPSEVTRLLEQVGRGAAGSQERLLALVYEELHGLAAGQMRGERSGHTLQPTALVHEAWMRLLAGQDPRFESRGHFYGAAAEVMRRLLVDHARSRSTLKRGGDREREALDEVADAWGMDEERAQEVLAVDAALEELGAIDEEKRRLVELRFFAGLTSEQIAELSGLSVPTVKRRWRYTRAWLYQKIREG